MTDSPLDLPALIARVREAEERDQNRFEPAPPSETFRATGTGRVSEPRFLNYDEREALDGALRASTTLVPDTRDARIRELEEGLRRLSSQEEFAGARGMSNHPAEMELLARMGFARSLLSPPQSEEGEATSDHT
ncbi:MAG: hypothetical protein AB7J28_15470 [Hyphomonadaceae bacterium]